MDKEKLGKRARRLYALWSVLISLFSIGVSVYMAYQEVVNGIDLDVIPTPFLFALCGILGFVFVPMLVLVRKWSKASDSEQLNKKATKLYWIFVIAIVGTLIVNILGFFFPGLFA